MRKKSKEIRLFVSEEHGPDVLENCLEIMAEMLYNSLYSKELHNKAGVPEKAEKESIINDPDLNPTY